MKVTIKASMSMAAEAAAITRNKKPPANTEAYVQKIVYAKGHRSIAEFTSYIIELQGITRHTASIVSGRRLVSSAEQSLRYSTPATADSDPEAKQSFEWYNKLLARGFAKEEARYVLSTKVLINMIVSINRREMHVLVNRLYADARVDTIELADTLVKLMCKDGMFQLQKDENIENEWPCKDIGIEIVDLRGEATGPRADELEFYRITDELSISALDQLKRHRMSTLIRCSHINPKQCNYYMFNDEEYLKIIEEASSFEFPILAAKQKFTWLINKRALRNFLDLRTDAAASTEIRNWSIDLKETLY